MARSSAAKARPVAKPATQSARPQAPEKDNPSSPHPPHAPNAPEHKQASVQPSAPPVEPEDAYLTGTSRSLQRRVLGLNVDGHHAQQHPETPAGQHATGSFTDKAND